jgi:PAS domain S-box-containing protein
VNIGKVDHGVALTLCDADAPDMPIVYCSEKFEALTGYTSPEIVGRNCRFLQTPPPDSPNKAYDANESARRELKDKLSRWEEARVQLINYTKDGRRFTNILTTIPIVWEGGRRYVVGFQVDAERAFMKSI